MKVTCLGWTSIILLFSSIIILFLSYLSSVLNFHSRCSCFTAVIWQSGVIAKEILGTFQITIHSHLCQNRTTFSMMITSSRMSDYNRWSPDVHTFTASFRCSAKYGYHLTIILHPFVNMLSFTPLHTSVYTLCITITIIMKWGYFHPVTVAM